MNAPLRMGGARLPSDLQTKSAGGGDLDLLTKAIEANNDALDTRLKAIDHKTADLATKSAAVMERMTVFEQKAAELITSARSGGLVIETPGALVVKSAALDAFKGNQYRGKHTIEVKAITSAATSAGALVAPDRQRGVDALPQRLMTIRNLLQPGQTESNLIEFPRQKTRTLNAGMVAEGATKPESSLEYELIQSPVRTIAHWVPASRQIFDDSPLLKATIDTELTYGLELKEEQQLLFGDGAGENLLGLYTTATEFSAPIAIPDATSIDLLRLAVLQVRLSEYRATAVVLNPIDLAWIELLKDSRGRYIVDYASGAPRIWGLPIIDTIAMPVDSFLVGAFGVAAQIFDRLNATILIADQHADFFIKNMLVILAEQRLALVNRRPNSFVRGDFGRVA